MPGLNRDATGADPIDLAECVARLSEDGCNLTCEDGIERAAGLLARLHANRDFLVDAALAALKDGCAQQQAGNAYGGQVLLLHRREGHFFIRANFWPAMDDPVARASGAAHYSYDAAHDHNFDFVTVGYLGPGYRSDWYDYDHDAVIGYAGEPVALNLTERGQLTPGRLLHYRAHRDIHAQHPPQSLSVSLNIVPENPGILWRDQYMFDLDRHTVAGIQTAVPSEAMLKLAVHFGAGNGRDLAEYMAACHPSHRVRWSAWRALIGIPTTADARLEMVQRAARAPSALVAGQARVMLDTLLRAESAIPAR
jgi:hypothetical protein